MARMPALFVSHGAPYLAVDKSPANAFLKTLAAALPRPRAILVASAHYETDTPTLSTAGRHETIHDFHGFPEALYEITYPAPGAPDVAREAHARLGAAGIAAATSSRSGLDHGVWVPLSLIFAEAELPVAPLSIQPGRDPEHHLRVGEALRPLRDDGILIIGSGAITHNLKAFVRDDVAAPPPDWVSAFNDWVAAAVENNRTEALLGYRTAAPFAARNHPTDEHFMPFFVALGAGDDGARAERLHASYAYGGLAMDVYRMN